MVNADGSCFWWIHLEEKDGIRRGEKGAERGERKILLKSSFR